MVRWLVWGGSLLVGGGRLHPQACRVGGTHAAGCGTVSYLYYSSSVSFINFENHLHIHLPTNVAKFFESRSIFICFERQPIHPRTVPHQETPPFLLMKKSPTKFYKLLKTLSFQILASLLDSRLAGYLSYCLILSCFFSFLGRQMICVVRNSSLVSVALSSLIAR